MLTRLAALGDLSPLRGARCFRSDVTAIAPVETRITRLGGRSTRDMSSSIASPTLRWLTFLLGLSLFYFYSGGGPNQGTRLNLDRALLEEGRLTTNSYYTNSEDRAHYRGDYYCDKAPGASFAALPALALARVFLRFVSVPTESAAGVSMQMHVATWTASTLPALLMGLWLYAWALRTGHSKTAATYAALGLGLASPFWAYGTLFWGNSLAAFCLVWAASAAMTAAARQRAGEYGGLSAGLAGLATGWAVLTEFETAPMAVALLGLLATQLRPWRVHWRPLLCYVCGAGVVASILAGYNHAAFGSPFHLGYENVEGFDGMKQGIFGVTWPKAEATAGVLWGGRGLLMTAPLLLLGVAGHAIAIVRERNRLLSALCLVFAFYPTLLAVSYVYWDGGWSYGPRHMSAAMPFLALGLAPLYDALPYRARQAAMGMLAVAIVMTMIAVATHGMTPWTTTHPWRDLYWPAFLSGNYAQHTGWMDAGGPATNLGVALGFPRAQSLVPLWLGMGIGLVGLFRSLRAAPERRRGATWVARRAR